MKKILKSLFEIKQVNGVDHYYFRNKSICDEPVFLYMNDHVMESGHDDEYELSFRNEYAMVNDSGPWDERSRVFNMDINIKKKSKKVSGDMLMVDDYNLSDDACVTFFNLGLNVGYLDPDGENFIYYDKAVIKRRNTINKIIL